MTALCVSRQCRECKFLFACNGECPKNRVKGMRTGEAALNYLCSGFQKFGHQIDPDVKEIYRNLTTWKWLRPSPLMAQQAKAAQSGPNFLHCAATVNYLHPGCLR